MKNIILQQRELLSRQNYIRKADPNSFYWFDFSRSKLDHYKKMYGENFNLIIAGDSNKPSDFYVIPFSYVKNLFSSEHLANDITRRPDRWIGTIKFDYLKLTNCPETLFVGDCKGVPLDSRINEDVKNDYSIENRRQEINQRLKQSMFRKSVLKNFQNVC